jgi:hypothetical protein
MMSSIRHSLQRIARRTMAPAIWPGLFSAALVSVAALASPPAHAGAAQSWTPWVTSSERWIQSRWRYTSFGRNMSGVCEIQFRATDEGTFNFRWEASYQPDGAGNRDGGRRVGQVYGVRTDSNSSGDTISGCRGVTNVSVTKIERRGISGSASDTSRRAPAGSRDSAPTRPSLTNVKLEPACVELLRAESEKLRLAGVTKTLLAWSPLIAYLAEGNFLERAVTVEHTHWEELAQAISSVDDIVLIRLATDARLHANSDHHFGNPTAKAFWNAMADFYAAQARR